MDSPRMPGRNANHCTNISAEECYAAVEAASPAGSRNSSGLFDDNPAYPAPLFPDTDGDDRFIGRNLKGNSLKRIPQWKFTAWSSCDWQFEPGVLAAGATWPYTGDYYSSGIERDLDRVPSRDRVDVYLTWRDHMDRWNVRAFVDNVFDEVNAREIDAGTPATDWELTARTLYPRFYGLDVTYRIGS